MAHLRVRLDDRLVHSEVIYGELEAASFDDLIVATTPEGLRRVDTTMVARATRVTRLTPEQVAGELLEGRRDGAVLVVMATLADLMAARASRFGPAAVVLANRAQRPGTAALGPTYHVDLGEVDALIALLAEGVAVVVQRVPALPATRLDAARLADVRLQLDGPQAGGGSSHTC